MVEGQFATNKIMGILGEVQMHGVPYGGLKHFNSTCPQNNLDGAPQKSIPNNPNVNGGINPLIFFF
jgi:hypothetical protein